MLGEQLTHLIILSEFAALLLLVLVSAWRIYKRGWKALPAWMRGGLCFLLGYVAFALPVFASRKVEFAVNTHDGLYAHVYWWINQPTVLAIEFLAYFKRSGLIDHPLLMHPFIVTFSSTISVAIGILCGV